MCRMFVLTTSYTLSNIGARHEECSIQLAVNAKVSYNVAQSKTEDQEKDENVAKGKAQTI